MNRLLNDSLADFYPAAPAADEPDPVLRYQTDNAADDDRPIPAVLSDPTAISRFVLGGNAYFTLKSKVSGKRFTYRVNYREGNNGYSGIYFVSVLTGTDNENDYSYFGHIRETANGTPFVVGKKAKLPVNSPAVRAFEWFWSNISARRAMPNLEVWHEGRCGRCARKLTVPESVASGFGPECRGKVGFVAEAA